MDQDVALVLNVFIALAGVFFGACHLALRQKIISRQREEIDGLRAKLSRKDLFGFADGADADDVVDEFCSDLQRIQDLLARGYIKDATLEIERALEHYA